MREILFRGKTKDGDWVYWNELGVINFDLTDTEISFYVHLLNDELMFETIEQYTGLTDKNGKKIFEGDILKVWYSSVEIEGFFENLEVYYDDGYAQYRAGYKDLYEIAESSEVIGNIFDNPELFEQK